MPLEKAEDVLFIDIYPHAAPRPEQGRGVRVIKAVNAFFCVCHYHALESIYSFSVLLHHLDLRCPKKWGGGIAK